MEIDSIRLRSKFNPRLVKIHSSFLTGHQVLSRVQASRRPITQPTLSGVANVAEIETRHRKNPSWLTRLDSPADYHNCLFYGCRRGKEEEKKEKRKSAALDLSTERSTKAALSTVNVEKVTRVRSRIDVYAVKRRKIEQQSSLGGCNLTIQRPIPRRIFFASLESLTPYFSEDIIFREFTRPRTNNIFKR